MVNRILIIGGIATASVGAGVGGYYLFHQSSSEKKTIENLLSEADKKKARLTITTKSESGWKEKWLDYVSSNSSNGVAKNTDIFGITEWSTIKSEKNSVPDAFARKCESLYTTEVNGKDDIRYTSFVTWCIK